MSKKGIIMFLGMNNTRLERKILIMEMGFYLPIYHCASVSRAILYPNQILIIPTTRTIDIL